MKLVFEKVRIHHFMSFGDAEIDLSNRGFCLIEGVNEDSRDAAKSNGSGKSTIWNAVSFALTGETLSGLRSNLANMAFNDGCNVSVDVSIDNKKVTITRYKDDPKLGTNLRISIDGVDVSGKGVRESQAVLDETFPDLTSELIGSVAMLGQGLPMRFTNNTPSGRKEVLEHLSKSDFMIEDLKTRLADRERDVSTLKRTLDDERLKLSTTLEMLDRVAKDAQKKYDDENAMTSFDEERKSLNADIASATAERDSLFDELRTLTERRNACVDRLSGIVDKKNAALDKVKAQHDENTTAMTGEMAELNVKHSYLSREIERLKSITDVCPTCGQKIQGVHKHDTSDMEVELLALNKSMVALKDEMKDDHERFEKVKSDIANDFDGDIADAKRESDETLSKTLATEKSLRDNESKCETLRFALESLNIRESEHSSRLASLSKTIEDAKSSMAKANEAIADVDVKLNDCEASRDALSKMSTLMKRDFRGYLLTDVITFVNAKAKEYASRIFNDDGVSFALNGNAIDITFLGKNYENLSGGEKQRLDLIVQFALRDMMSAYSGFSSNILVLDEITDALDSVSCERVMDFVTNGLSDVESVFIVSHHSDELSIPYDGVIRIRKTKDGISEVIE